MSGLLLFAILITLLGAWPFVGNTVLVVLFLLVAAGVLIGGPVLLWAGLRRIAASCVSRSTTPAGDQTIAFAVALVCGLVVLLIGVWR
jgi:hypothetical protein